LWYTYLSIHGHHLPTTPPKGGDEGKAFHCSRGGAEWREKGPEPEGGEGAFLSLL